MYIKRKSIIGLLIFTILVSTISAGILGIFSIKSSISADTGSVDTSYPFVNPISTSANDPWVIYDNVRDVYYYCWSGGNGVRIAEINEFYGFNNTSKYIQAWTRTTGTMYSSEIWAPELHKIGNKWYIYVAASDGNNVNHRMYVMESKTENPMEGFNFIGKITDTSDRWAIDGTVMQYKGKMYFIWSGWEGTTDTVGGGPGQILYIAEMTSPSTISTNRVEIARAQLDWERSGGVLLEGPVAVEHNGKMHILYSGSASWTNYYCIGSLTLTGTDPLKAASWTKASQPILYMAETMYGPGHPSVVKGRDGRDWIIYHANQVSGSGWSGRNGWAQLLMWDENNNPVIPLLRIGSTVIDKNPLTETIKKAKTAHSGAVIGAKPGNVPAAAANKFLDDIEAAEQSWARSLRQSSITNAITKLETAITTFNSAVIVSSTTTAVKTTPPATTQKTTAQKTPTKPIDNTTNINSTNPSVTSKTTSKSDTQVIASPITEVETVTEDSTITEITTQEVSGETEDTVENTEEGNAETKDDETAVNSTPSNTSKNTVAPVQPTPGSNGNVDSGIPVLVIIIILVVGVAAIGGGLFYFLKIRKR